MQKSQCLPAHSAIEDFTLLLVLLLLMMAEPAVGFSSTAKAKARIREAVKVTFPHVSTTWKPKKEKRQKVNSSILYNTVRVVARCLKITEKVSFNIASEASYVYILSGQKLIKNAKNGPF